MSICIIPARGGSKRIPRKNVKLFHGKPMISWSITAALESKVFDRVIVSTDDPEIVKAALSSGGEVPFVRPKELSDDMTPTVPVIQHAISELEKNGEVHEAVCCLYATAPFVTPNDIEGAFNLLERSKSEFCFPVTTFPFPIQRAVRIKPDGFIEMLNPEYANTRSQDLEEIYHDAGQFYWGTLEAWKSGRPIFNSKAAPFIIPRYRVQDIDTLEDWNRAEALFTSINVVLK